MILATAIQRIFTLSSSNSLIHKSLHKTLLSLCLHKTLTFTLICLNVGGNCCTNFVCCFCFFIIFLFSQCNVCLFFMGFLSVIEIKRSELILVYSNAVMWTKTSICALLKFNLDKIFHQLTGESFIRYILVYSHRALSPLIAGIMASTRAVSSAVSV